MSRLSKRLKIAIFVVLAFWLVVLAGLFLVQISLHFSRRPTVHFGHGVSYEDLIDNLMQNIDVIALALGADDMQISRPDLITYIGFDMFSTNVSAITFHNHISANGIEWPIETNQTFRVSVRANVGQGHLGRQNITWTVVSFYPGGLMLDAPPYNPEDQILDIENDFFIMRFYYYDWPTGGWGEAFSVTDALTTENWQHDMRRMLWEYGGYRVKDIWLEGTNLVVNIYPFEYFMMHRNWHAETYIIPFLLTLENFPGIDSYEILVAGSRETWGGLDGKTFAVVREEPPPKPEPPPERGTPRWNEMLVQDAWRHLPEDTSHIADILGADEVYVLDINNFPHTWSDSHLLVQVEAILYDHLFAGGDVMTQQYEIIISWTSPQHWSIFSLRPFSRFTDTRLFFVPGTITENETFNLRVVYFDDDPGASFWWTYQTHQVSSENWVQEVIDLVRHHSGHRLHHMWVRDGKLFVDVSIVDSGFIFDGSGAGMYNGATLLYTLFDLPGIKEIEISFGGEREWFDMIFKAEDYAFFEN